MCTGVWQWKLKKEEIKNKLNTEMLSDSSGCTEAINQKAEVLNRSKELYWTIYIIKKTINTNKSKTETNSNLFKFKIWSYQRNQITKVTD